jgi:hypothetical protein
VIQGQCTKELSIGLGGIQFGAYLIPSFIVVSSWLLNDFYALNVRHNVSVRGPAGGDLFFAVLIGQVMLLWSFGIRKQCFLLFSLVHQVRLVLLLLAVNVKSLHKAFATYVNLHCSVPFATGALQVEHVLELQVVQQEKVKQQAIGAHVEENAPFKLAGAVALLLEIDSRIGYCC